MHYISSAVRVRAAMLLSLALAAASACSGDDPEPPTSDRACVPGQQVECACQGGTKSVQVCRGDGSGYDKCACDSADSGQSDGAIAADAQVPTESGSTTPDAPDGQTSSESGPPTPDGSEEDGRGSWPDGGPCTTNIECTARATAADGGILADGGVRSVPAICLRQDGRCVELLSEDCNAVAGDYLDDDAIILGTLFATVGAQSATNLQRQGSATLALEQINAAGGIPGSSSAGRARPLVMVACNETTNPVRAGGHLVADLHVPAIVGPASDQNALDLSNNLTIAAGTVLLTPTASAASIAELADNDLTWLMVPSDMQRGKLLTNQINQLETELRAIRGKPTIRLAIAYRNDAVGLGTVRSLNDLVINGKPLNDPINAGSPAGNVTIDGYELSAPNHDALVSRYVSFAPDIIVLAGLAEVITTVMNPIEQRWSDAGVQRPYYVLTEQLKGPDLITSATNLPTLRPRVRGTGVISTGSSLAVNAAFEVDYRARYGVTPAARGAGQAFDAAYAIAYALAATRDQSVSGASIASGLRKLAGGATTVNVGAADITTAMAQLGAGESITAIGTFAGLAWDARGAVAGGTLEVWCIGSSAGTAVYQSSGLGYDVAAGTFFGTYVQCSP